LSEDLNTYRPRMEKLLKRAKREAAHAARRGDAKAEAAYTRAAGHMAEAIANLPPTEAEKERAEEEQAEALRAELRRRIALFHTYDEPEPEFPPGA
jgi:hypothetical protein